MALGVVLKEKGCYRFGFTHLPERYLKIYTTFRIAVALTYCQLFLSSSFSRSTLRNVRVFRHSLFSDNVPTAVSYLADSNTQIRQTELCLYFADQVIQFRASDSFQCNSEFPNCQLM